MTKAVTIKEYQQLQQEYKNYLKEKREVLKARIDEIDGEFRLHLLENFLDGLLED